MDDEQAVQTLLTYPLRKEGYEVVGAMDGQEALDRFGEERFDLVVLDIMLPKLDGIEVCRRLRTRSQVPIIMLTAKGDEVDKVAGLEMGADDYITKPFSVARVPQPGQGRAAARRDGRPGDSPANEPIRAGALEIDFERRSVTLASEPVQLTYVEFEILAALAAAPGTRLHPRDAARAHLGRLHLPRSPHRRRPHQASPREARVRRQASRVPVHGARRRLPLSRHATAIEARH